MKKIFIIILTLVVVSGMCFADGGAAGWEKLQKLRKVEHIKWYKATVQKINKRYERGFVVELELIRAALEKAGVAEPVEIELRYRSTLVERLGTYTPKLETKDGKTDAVFDTIPVGRRIFSNLASVKADYRTDVGVKDPDKKLMPEFQLVFKDSGGKIKAILKATFLKITR
ncbi:MAG: hypothetical protein GY950_13090 [bacterium]|nr:hypothetical protein [bacterium]